MAGKEMLIVFLYDTEICTKEEDDPMSSLLFFAPSWVRLAFTGNFFKYDFIKIKNFRWAKRKNLRWSDKLWE